MKRVVKYDIGQKLDDGEKEITIVEVLVHFDGFIEYETVSKGQYETYSELDLDDMEKNKNGGS
jgi:hypothetical protein